MRFLLAVLFASLLVLNSRNVDAACGYKACPATKSNMINVHLVPHSHDDVGWLKTVDQYYYGSRTSIQRAGVEQILDNVIQELLKNSNRRFIQVESAFFYKWYSEQTATVKSNVKKLVENGQFEFTGGAWSMNDEAAVHYQSVIDQFTVGLKYLSDTFGTCARPRIGWQIDPFGHSREMASLFAQMGFDGEFFARLDWVERSQRFLNLTGEMIWKASADLGERSEIFTGILYNHYSAPPGFCFDTLCSDDPIIDGSSVENNVKEKVDAFIAYINSLAKYYRATHLLVPMGDDFNYENAVMNFKNMDKLIKYVNERQAQGTKINVFYSTPSCYLNELHESKLTWPNKTQDFFPYSSDWHTYWTGYFSSRPTQKRFERDGNHVLQVTKQLTTLANFTDATTTANLNKLRQVMGVMQHHDAITGTEKQHVSNDYDRMLTEGILAAQKNAQLALQKLTNLTNGEFSICLQLNVSVCEFTNSSANNVVVTLYNPLAHDSMQYVRVPVPVINDNYEVTDAAGQLIRSQLVPVPKEVTALNPTSNTNKQELVFEAYVDKIANYYIKTKPKPRSFDKHPKNLRGLVNKTPEYINAENRADIIIQNSLIKLTFGSTGHLNNVQMNGISETIRQDFFYYKGAAGNNAEFKNRSSGAYIFRPNGTEIQLASTVSLTIYEGVNVKEVHQRFNDWVSQVIRIYDGVNRVEFEWLIGPIPIQDNIGKEVITRFTSTFNSKGVFFTDSNGREIMQRTRNVREYFKPNLTETISSNYYPITSLIALQNDLTNNAKRIALLNDRAQGGTSVKDGSLELMLHRRLLRDDAFGVGEALNETQYGKGLIARGKVYLILGQVNQRATYNERLAQQQIHLPFLKFFSTASKATNKVVPKTPSFMSLPLTIQVLTLEPYSTTERLLRLESYMSRNETTTTTFNIRKIFDSLGGEEIRETTLDGNMALESMKRFKFQPDGGSASKVEYYTSKHTPLSAKKKDADSKFNVTFDPMQIRTFIIKWK